MRLLILSDLHGQHSTLDKLEERIAAADLILCAGDFTEFGDEADMESMLEPFSEAAARFAAVPGNCDRKGARRVLEDKKLSVDGRFRRIITGACAIDVIGAGGGVFRNGLTPYERKEADLHDAIEDAVKLLDDAEKAESLLVATTHTPPKDTEADLRHGSHVGSRSLRHMLDALDPVIWACGHIHESRSVSRLGRCLLVNPGPLREGFFAEGELLKGKEWKAELELKRL